MVPAPTAIAELEPNDWSIRKATSVANVFAHANPAQATMYTKNVEINTGLLPIMSATLPQNKGEIP
jgi:hypothetical protein